MYIYTYIYTYVYTHTLFSHPYHLDVGKVPHELRKFKVTGSSSSPPKPKESSSASLESDMLCDHRQAQNSKVWIHFFRTD